MGLIYCPKGWPQKKKLQGESWTRGLLKRSLWSRAHAHEKALFFCFKCAHSPTREEPTNNVAFLHVVWCKFVLKGPDPYFCQIINFSQLKIHTSSIYITFMLGVIWSWIQRTGKTDPLKVFGSSGSTPKQAARSAGVQRNVTKMEIPKEKKSWQLPSKIINGAMSISTNQPNPNYNIWERDLQLTIIFLCSGLCAFFSQVHQIHQRWSSYNGFHAMC